MWSRPGCHSPATDIFHCSPPAASMNITDPLIFGWDAQEAVVAEWRIFEEHNFGMTAAFQKGFISLKMNWIIFIIFSIYILKLRTSQSLD